MGTPFFSIVIPVYNGISNGLPTCLDSIWGPVGIIAMYLYRIIKYR